MNELQLLEKLLAMVGNAGEGAFWLAVMWIAKDYFTGMLVAGTIAVVVSIVCRRIVQPLFFAEELAGWFGFFTPLSRAEKNVVRETIMLGKKYMDGQDGHKAKK